MSGHVLGRFLFALRIAPSRVEVCTAYNTRFLGPTRIHIPHDISIGSAVFAGLTVITDRPTDLPTDRPRYSVCSNRPHLASTAMRPNNNHVLQSRRQNSRVSYFGEETVLTRAEENDYPERSVRVAAVKVESERRSVYIQSVDAVG